MRNVIYLALLLALPHLAEAQLATDVLRYSQFDLSSTARSMGSGNTQGILGADYSNMVTNPAGLANYRSGEFVMTPTLSIMETRSKLSGQTNEEYKEELTKFGFNGIGFVFAGNRSASDWTTVNFGIGYHKLADYNRSIFYEGAENGSIAEYFAEQADGLTPSELDNFITGPAFDAGVIYNGTPDPTRYSIDTRADDLINRNQQLTTSGSYGEINMTLAGNYKDKLQLGGTMGIPIISYTERNVYEESGPVQSADIFENLMYTQRLKTTGRGFNMRMGANYRINQMIRVGGAIQLPSFLKLEDNFSSEINYQFNLNGDAFDQTGESPEGNFQYRLRTPAKYTAGAGFIFGRSGFLTAEFDYQNFGNATFSFINGSAEDEAYERVLNRSIDDDFKSTLTTKLGGEVAYEIFRFRAGYIISGTPYAQDSGNNNTWSVGAGFRGERGYLDIGFQQSETQDALVPYQLNDAARRPNVNETLSRNQIILTIGFRL